MPATDALGRLSVTGKFRALENQVILHWKEKDRTFTRSKNQMRTIELTYDDLEEAKVVGGWWWFSKKILIVQLKDPRTVEEMPGVQMGKVELELPPKSIAPAKRFVSMLDFRMSEVAIQRRQQKLNELGI